MVENLQFTIPKIGKEYPKKIKLRAEYLQVSISKTRYERRSVFQLYPFNTSS